MLTRQRLKKWWEVLSKNIISSKEIIDLGMRNINAGANSDGDS